MSRFVGLLAAFSKKAKLPFLFQLRGIDTTSPHSCYHEKYSMRLFEELNTIYEPFEDEFV